MLVCVALQCAAQSGEDDRARRLLAAGQAADAAAIYRKLSRANPANADLLVNLSIAEYKAGDFSGSAGSAAAALKLQPDLLPARLFLGASQLELGEFAQAIESLERVIAAAPNERNGRLMLGEALLGAGRAAEALDHLRAAAAMLPSNPRVWSLLGRGYEALGRAGAALEAWERLMALPPSAESHTHAAEVHGRERRWREAAAEWMAALKLAPGSRAARMGLAWSQFRSRDHGGALMTLQPLLGGAGAETPFLYGASLLNLQRPAEAIAYLKDAIERDPRMLPARAALGQALLQTGKAGEAIPLLRQAVAGDEDGSIHFQLFRAYQITGRNAEAREALEAYRRMRAAPAR